MVRISVCMLTHDRAEEVTRALASLGPVDEILVLDNATEPPLAEIEGATMLRSDVNTGVTVGRNMLSDAASGDLIVVIDDDAVACSDVIEQVRVFFEANADVGLVAFGVQRSDGEVASHEVPLRGSFSAVPGEGRDVAYFVGCGYAVRACALDEVGGYDPDFFYSNEEIDLGVRLLKAGWRLRYEPSIRVEHRPSQRGRGSAPDVPGFLARNRIVYARRHLKLPVAALHIAVWTARTMVASRHEGGFGRWRRRFVEGFTAPVERDPMSWRMHAHVHRLGGRVLY